MGQDTFNPGQVKTRRVHGQGLAAFIENLVRERKQAERNAAAASLLEKNFRHGTGKLITAPEAATFSRKKCAANQTGGLKLP